jgi:hypothetical protein
MATKDVDLEAARCSRAQGETRLTRPASGPMICVARKSVRDAVPLEEKDEGVPVGRKRGAERCLRLSQPKITSICFGEKKRWFWTNVSQPVVEQSPVFVWWLHVRANTRADIERIDKLLEKKERTI